VEESWEESGEGRRKKRMQRLDEKRSRREEQRIVQRYGNRRMAVKIKLVRKRDQRVEKWKFSDTVLREIKGGQNSGIIYFKSAILCDYKMGLLLWGYLDCKDTCTDLQKFCLAWLTSY
jgi:hypothetical protein